jgi:hypothetical protein
VILHSTNWMKKNPNYAGFGQEISFASATSALLAVARQKGAAAPCTCTKECSKYDLTAAQCFRLAHHNDWSRWFAISSSPPIWCPSSFSFICGVAKEYIIAKLGCAKYFHGVTY